MAEALPPNLAELARTQPEWAKKFIALMAELIQLSATKKIQPVITIPPTQADDALMPMIITPAGGWVSEAEVIAHQKAMTEALAGENILAGIEAAVKVFILFAGVV